jgi:polar amino acid transport system substrate-binding protein
LAGGNVKRISGVIAVLFLASAVLAACSGGGTSTLPNLPSLKVLTDPTYPPFEQVNTDTKTIVGFDVDLMNAVAAKAGYIIQFDTSLNYDKLRAAVDSCQSDIAISAIPIADSQKTFKNLIFSDPYFTFGEVVTVKTGNTAITGPDKLVGMVVGVQNNTTSQTEVAKIQGAKGKVYPTFDLAFKDLLNGLIDAVVADRITAQAYVTANPNSLKIVGSEFAMESYGIALCNTKTDLQKKINDALAALKSDGTISSLSDKWLSKPVIQ